MTRVPDLKTQASDFAKRLTRLLNTTVCDHARIGASLRTDGLVYIGTSMDGRTFRARPQRLRTARGAHCFLTIHARLYLDPDQYLTVERSAWIVSGGEDGSNELFHYDYERDKDHYAEAHLQINATSPAFEELLTSVGRHKPNPGKLHLPVGGRRFRPAIEDIIEFLIAEKIVEAKPYALSELDRSRTEFRRSQLKAAIRRDPDAALAALADMGYAITGGSTAAKVVSILRQRGGRRQKKP